MGYEPINSASNVLYHGVGGVQRSDRLTRGLFSANEGCLRRETTPDLLQKISR
jgi:hypothetical protein